MIFLLMYQIIRSGWNVNIAAGSARKLASKKQALKSITVYPAENTSKNNTAMQPASQALEQ